MNHISDALRRHIDAGATLVVPSRQRAQALRFAVSRERIAAGTLVWPSPDVLPFDAWIARDVERRAAAGADLPRILSPAEEWTLWRDATDHALEALTDGSLLLSRGPLAEGLRRADALAFEYDIEAAARRGDGSPESDLLRNASAWLRDACLRLGAAPAARIAGILDVIGSDQPLVVLLGFATLTPRQRRIVEARAAAGLETLMLEVGDPEGSVALVTALDEHDQLARLAAWTRDVLDRNGSARLLVVVPSSPALRARAAAVIRQAIEPVRVLHAGTESAVAIEGGEPLSRQPVVRAALQTLELLSRPVESQVACTTLADPYVLRADPNDVARLLLWLRAHAPLEFAAAQLPSILGRVSTALLPAAETLVNAIGVAVSHWAQGRASMREWADRARDALGAMGWPGARVLSSDEQQALMRFQEMLQELADAASTRAVDSQGALRAMRDYATRVAFRPASGDVAVTLTASVADPIVEYDGIWVAGLDAASWPIPTSANPYLPLAAQREAGVPGASPDGGEASAMHAARAWRARSAEVVFSASTHVGDLEVPMSPLISALRAEAATAPTQRAPGLAELLRSAPTLERVDDRVGRAWPTQRNLRGGTRALELQNACPFRAYAELRLGAEAPRERVPGIAPDERGRWLHKALEAFWQEVRDSERLHELGDAARQRLIELCVAESAPAELVMLDTSTTALSREAKRLVRLVATLVRRELDRKRFRVLHVEQTAQLALAQGELTIRIDRIDALDSGGLAIIDYKSGRARPPDWYGDRPSHPQLLAYGHAIGDDVRVLATANVSGREVRFQGIAAEKDLLPRVSGVKRTTPDDADPWTTQRGRWASILDRLMTDFIAGRADVDPVAGACKYCHLSAFCRIVDPIETAEDEAAIDE